MEQIAAYGQLLLKFRPRGGGNIRLSVVFPVPCGVIVHRPFQRGGDAHIVDHKAALLIAKNSIDAGNGLHEIVAGHGLIDIHRGQRRHVKASQPHIHHDGDLQRAFVVLKFPRQVLPVAFVPDNGPPLLRVFVALRHYDGDLFHP